MFATQTTLILFQVFVKPNFNTKLGRTQSQLVHDLSAKLTYDVEAPMQGLLGNVNICIGLSILAVLLPPNTMGIITTTNTVTTPDNI